MFVTCKLSRVGKTWEARGWRQRGPIAIRSCLRDWKASSSRGSSTCLGLDGRRKSRVQCRSVWRHKLRFNTSGRASDNHFRLNYRLRSITKLVDTPVVSLAGRYFWKTTRHCKELLSVSDDFPDEFALVGMFYKNFDVMNMLVSDAENIQSKWFQIYLQGPLRINLNVISIKQL